MQEQTYKIELLKRNLWLFGQRTHSGNSFQYLSI